MSIDAALARLSQSDLTAQKLADIAHRHPELHAHVAAHPLAYPDRGSESNSHAASRRRIVFLKPLAMTAMVLALTSCGTAQPAVVANSAYVTAEPETSAAAEPSWRTQIVLGRSSEDLEFDSATAVQVLRDRIAVLGIEGKIVEQSAGQIAVLLMADENDDRIKMLTSPHNVTFRPVYVFESTGQDASSGRNPDAVVTDDEFAALDDLDCTENVSENFADVQRENTSVTCSRDSSTKYILGPAELTGEDLATVETKQATTADGTPLLSWPVTLTLAEPKTSLLESLTTSLSQHAPPGNLLAITLDGTVITAPSVESPITGGAITISGGLPESEEASRELALTLKLSMRPLTMNVLSETALR